jgi:hypothetical protein
MCAWHEDFHNRRDYAPLTISSSSSTSSSLVAYIWVKEGAPAPTACSKTTLDKLSLCVGFRHVGQVFERASQLFQHS